MTQPQRALAIVTHVQKALEDRRAELLALGVRAELIEPQALDSPASSTTEVAIYFWKEATLVDVLEFPIDGSSQQPVSVAETTKWFDDALRDVIRRVESGLAGL
ncbi:MAG TPA: hypothetical protein VFW04_16940 [Gemmatimonadaceae bacterium]|nr:hypothetical protein [Gemmatimonadaceae bacterium]HSC31443.1 hypothetical protein [Gemmatimonadaceae bacterium]